MNIAAIVSEIDAEIEKLHRIRDIVRRILGPTDQLRLRRKQTSGQARKAGSPKPSSDALPRLDMAPSPQTIVLPLGKRREYRLRRKSISTLPKALARAPSTQPVFVPRSALANAKPAFSAKSLSGTGLEAAIRHNLIGGFD